MGFLKPPSNPIVEERRLEVLRQLDVLDTEHEDIFDNAVMIASAICGVPIAAVSLVADDRQWFKASVGLEVSETPKDIAFCAHAIYQLDPLIVSDATEDERFSDNPLVTGNLQLRFYAGVQLHADNVPIGALCVIDRQPRNLSAAQLGALEVLAHQVSECLNLRLKKNRLDAREKAFFKALASVGIEEATL